MTYNQACKKNYLPIIVLKNNTIIPKASEAASIIDFENILLAPLKIPMIFWRKIEKPAAVTQYIILFASKT